MSLRALTLNAFALLIEDLESHGNRPNELHRAALLELVDTLTGYAYGTAWGRSAFGLPTGCGKTSAIVAWITAAHRLGLEDIAVAVAAGQVEALCDIKRRLLAGGVPEHRIGLKHSVESASESSTGNDSRQFQLVTHARVRGGNDENLLLKHLDSQRKVLIYDETFFRSNASAVLVHDVSVALAAFREHVALRGGNYKSVAEYLTLAKDVIAQRLASLKPETAESEIVINLPKLSDVEFSGYMAQLERISIPGVNVTALSNLLELSQGSMRLMTTGQGAGVVAYQIAIPEKFRDVLVLDASFAIRKLVHLDSSLELGWSFANYDLKRYDNVTIHQMLTSGSRTAVTDSFRPVRSDERHLSREVVHVVKNHEKSQGVLIFTYRTRDVDIGKRLLDDLKGAGIDTEERLPGGRKRINVLTWGSETSLNDYGHCDLVIMVGVLHRSDIDIGSIIVGQSNDLQTPVDNLQIKAMRRSEICHLIYQGASRGTCRIIDNGQAKAMVLYLIHKDEGIRKELEQVMKGAVWKRWESQYLPQAPAGVVDMLALEIKDYLEAMPQTELKVPSRMVKRALKIDPDDQAKGKVFNRAVKIVIARDNSWSLQGRSLVRTAIIFAQTTLRT